MTTLQVNGRAQRLDVDPSTPILWALRDALGEGLVDSLIKPNDDIWVRVTAEATPRTPRPGVPVQLLTKLPLVPNSYSPKLASGCEPLAADSTLPSEAMPVYSWASDAPGVTFGSPDAVTTSFTAPVVTEPTEITVALNISFGKKQVDLELEVAPQQARSEDAQRSFVDRMFSAMHGGDDRAMRQALDDYLKTPAGQGWQKEQVTVDQQVAQQRDHAGPSR